MKQLMHRCNITLQRKYSLEQPLENNGYSTKKTFVRTLKGISRLGCLGCTGLAQLD
jgi:hypothetical protein